MQRVLAAIIFALLSFGCPTIAQPVSPGVDLEAFKRAKQADIEGKKRDAEAAKKRKALDAVVQRGPGAIAARKSHAEQMEDRFLTAGFDMHVYAEGDAATTLRLRYVLMSRPVIYKLVNETKLREDARRLGFRRIVFASGHDTPYVYDLVADKFE